MRELEPGDIAYLDAILQICWTQDKCKSVDFINEFKEQSDGVFECFLGIMKEYNAVDVHWSKNRGECYAERNSETETFVAYGGFTTIYIEQLKESKHNENVKILTQEQIQSISNSKNYSLASIIISVVGLIVAIIAVLKNI